MAVRLFLGACRGRRAVAASAVRFFLARVAGGAWALLRGGAFFFWCASRVVRGRCFGGVFFFSGAGRGWCVVAAVVPRFFFVARAAGARCCGAAFFFWRVPRAVWAVLFGAVFFFGARRGASALRFFFLQAAVGLCALGVFAALRFFLSCGRAFDCFSRCSAVALLAALLSALKAGP